MPTHQTWDEIPITSTLNYVTDFWIVISLPDGGPYDGVWAISDDGIDHPGRSAKWGPSPYTSGLNGDLCIRAVVSYTGIEEEELSIPNRVALYQNSPNPVLNESTISYTIPEEMNIELKVYDITGKLVKTLIHAEQEPGYYSVVWDMRDNAGKQLSSGIYFYRLETPKFTATKKLIIVQ